MPELTFQYPPIWNVLNGGKPYEPFAWQAQHLHSKVDTGFRRIILPVGRRGGKSTSVVAEVVREVIKPPVEVFGKQHSAIVYIIGPTSETSMRVFEPVWNAFVPSESGSYVPPLGFLYEWHDKNRGVIGIKGGARIYRKTADDPRALQGERVTLAIPDESQDINEDAWENLMPALADSNGLLIAIGIAKGRGRFRSYFNLGLGADQNFYSAVGGHDSSGAAYGIPSTENPIFRQKALAEGRDVEEYIRTEFAPELTDDEFSRQYMARWTEEDGQVFRDLSRAFTAPRTHAHPGGYYGMSLDVGKLHDFSVWYVGDMRTGTFIAGDRFVGIDYVDQAPRIAKAYRAFGCQFIHMDSTGVGEAVAELLRREGCNVLPFKFTNESKAGLISTFVREIERDAVHLLKDDTVLRREMEMFEAEVSGTTVKYNAPKGYFDDCVIAAALLVQRMALRHTYANNPVRKPYVSFGAPSRVRVA